MIAPMVAAEDTQIAFLVLLAAPGVPARALMTAQRQAVMASLGASPDAIARSQALMAKVDDAVLQAKDANTARAEATRILSEAGSDIPPAAAAVQASMIGNRSSVAPSK